jgi:type IV secretory pathway protease TraF
VQFCLPVDLATFALDRGIGVDGYCPGGRAPFVKVLAAEYPDVIDVCADGIHINGSAKPWPLSAIPKTDSHGRPIPFRMKPGRYVMGPFDVLLLGVNSRSWDSRIIGIQPRSIVTGSWWPVPFITATIKDTL